MVLVELRTLPNELLVQYNIDTILSCPCDLEALSHFSSLSTLARDTKSVPLGF